MKLIVWGGSADRGLLDRPCNPSELQVSTWSGYEPITYVVSSGATLHDTEANNLAFGKPTSQSSTLPNEYGGPPEKAVDGDCNGVWIHASCTHTNLERNPWWLVDLKKSYKIYAVVVKNREDCCGERLHEAEVHLGDSLENNGRSNPLCGIILNTSPGSITTIYCNGQQGRYISVHLPGENYLTICELEAYGSK